MSEETPEYSDIKIAEDETIEPDHEITDIAKYVDHMKEQKKAELQQQMAQYEENIELPDDFNVAAHKYDLNPDIPNTQKEGFKPNRAFYGVHVVNSNTKRTDNFRHLMMMDLTDDYDLIPTRRHRGNQLRQRVTAEYQMCRSNPEIGGFDRKLQRSVLKREDVDVKQASTLSNMNNKNEKRGILGLIKRK